MPTITKEAIEWMQDEHDSKDEIIAELEEELIEALEENAALKIEIQRLMTDRSMAV